MLIALITVPFVGRFRLVLLPDRASLPPTTFDTTLEPVEPAQGPGLATVHRLPLRRSEVA